MRTLPRRTFLSALALIAAACTEKPAASAPAAAPDAAQAYERASKASGFSVGALMAANTVYVFFDPACPHCAHLWEQSQPLLKRLKMVWLPVGILRKTSAPQGAAILSASDPAQAMALNEASVLARGPGIEVPAHLAADALAKVEANTKLFNELGADSVPYIVFKNGKSGQYGSRAGAASTDELAALAGI
jgi:thiol:disulfide interchange protein DsbG